MRTFFVLDVDMFGRDFGSGEAVPVEAESEREAARAWADKAIDDAGEGATDGSGARCLVSAFRGGEEREEFIIRQSVVITRTLTVKGVAQKG